jgi:YEATS domain-containing protein 4
VYGNTAVYMSQEEVNATGHTHRWTVCVRSAASPEPTDAEKQGVEPVTIGGADDISYFVKKVSFKLHETYPTPLRSALPAYALCPSVHPAYSHRQAAL